MEMSKYSTWYEFKKDLQRETGRTVLNADWLDVKPEAPLPWGKAHLRVALTKLRRSNDRKLLARRIINVN